MIDETKDEFVEEEALANTDIIACPVCGSEIQLTGVFDDEIECPECGKVFNR